MKHFKIYLIILFISIGSVAYSQNNFAINATGTKGNQAAILDLSANSNLGMLLPDISLSGLTSASPFTAPPDGLMVYNTNASMPYGTGFYYWSATASSWYYITNSGTAGAVTSVGLSMPTIFSVTGSPVTSSGTLSASFTNENANFIFAGPASGSPAAPTFRAMALADLPAGIPNANLSNSTFIFNSGSGITITGSPVALGGTVTITGTGSNITSIGPAAEGSAQTGTSGLTFSANPITTGAGTISLAKSGVISGTYGSATTIAGITVNAEGQVTSETTYTPSVGTVTSITAGTPGSPTGSSGLTFTPNPITTTGSIAIATGGVTNAMLANPSITVNAGNNLTTTSASIALGGTSTIGISAPVTTVNGGTGTITAPAQWGVIYASTATTYSSTAAGATGTILAGNGSAAPSFQTITAVLGNGYIKNQTTLQSTANFNIQSVASGNVGGIIEGATGQTADLIDFDNSTPAVLAKVDVSGNVTSTGLNTSGTTNLNSTGSATTTIGNGGTGAVILGNAAGMVGVGTTTPVNLFNVNGVMALGQASATTGVATFYNSANTGAASIQAGSLSSANSYTLTLPLAQGASGSILTNDGTGVLSWASPNTLITANNGLTETGSNIQLGGALVQNTVVNASGSNYTMAFDLGTGSSAGTGTFSVNNGGTSNPYLYIGKSANGASVGIGNNTPGNNLLNVSTSAASTGAGNGVTMQAQTGATSNAGGAVAITGGAAGSNAAGGAVTIAAGTSTGTAAGNNVVIQAGAFSSSGTNGGVAINNSGAAPSPAAIVDMSSTSAGLLIPRVASATNAIPTTIIASPVTGLMVFNTTTGCFEFYNGSSWQAMTCSCYGAPGTPASISGYTTVCASASNTYTVSSVSGATGYTWSVSSGTITSGQGTSVVTITAPASGTFTISVYATNPCGSSSTITQAVTTTNTVPLSGTISGAISVCLSSPYTTTYTISGATGATYYVWTFPANITINSGQGTASVNVTFSTSATSGTISCLPYSSQGGCPAASPATLPYITGTSAPGTPTITPACGSTLITSYSTSFSVPNVAGDSYSWTVPSSVGSIVGSSTNYSVSVTAAASAGSGTISCAVTNGCGTGTGTYSVTVVGHGVATYTTVGTTNWTVPCGVTQATIYLFGGGGGGGGSFESSPNDFLNGGGGGGGACGVATITGLVGGNTYTVNVGAGGAGGTTTSPDNGSTGGSTTFSGPAGTWDADGGAGGTGASVTTAGLTFAGGGGATTGSGTGITIYDGGSGNAGHNGTSSTTGYTGTGGGGAGSAGNGNAPASNASSCNTAGGAGGPGTYPGGAGGYNIDCGGITNSAGSPGSQPGGGGSGDNNWTAAETGSNGGNGQAVIVY